MGDGASEMDPLSMESRSVILLPKVTGTLLMIWTLLASSFPFLLLFLALNLSLFLSPARPSRFRILICLCLIWLGRGGLWARARDETVTEVDSVVVPGSYPKKGEALGFTVVSPLGFSGSKRPSGSDKAKELAEASASASGLAAVSASASASGSASGRAEGSASAPASGIASGWARADDASNSATRRVTACPW